MLAERLKLGDTIGIISPSHVASADIYGRMISAIEEKGFRVKTGRNLYKDTYGYLASEEERAGDLNEMVSDEEVRLILFGGGYGSIEVLPFVDYENIKKHPKLFLSYSDGTSILNAIYTKTGLITYYGQCPREFQDATDYNYGQFCSHLLRGDADFFIGNSKWYSLREGSGEGILIGGYTQNFVLSLNTPYLQIDCGKKYILFLEDHEMFSCVAAVSTYLSHIEQNGFIENIAGLLFGNYSDTVSVQLFNRLRRFGEKHGIPVAYCDDFGHGINHAIFPVGGRARLDTAGNSMQFM